MCLPEGVSAHGGCVHLPRVDRMREACKNITFQETSVADGKYVTTINFIFSDCARFYIKLYIMFYLFLLKYATILSFRSNMCYTTDLRCLLQICNVLFNTFLFENRDISRVYHKVKLNNFV